MYSIKDYTERIPAHPIGPDSIPIRFVLYSPGSTKLALVKAIKFATGMGLKEAKDFIDETGTGYNQTLGMIGQPVMFKKYMTSIELDKFRNELSVCRGAEYDIDDREKIRNKKLIDIGIYEKGDLISELTEMSIDNLFMNGFDLQKLKELLNRIYSDLSEEKLKEIYDNKNYLKFDLSPSNKYLD